MKKMKIVTLIGLFAVLTACSEKAVVEKPSFVSFKNEVSFNDFTEALGSILDKNPVTGATLESAVPSFESKGSTKINSETSYTRSGEGKTMSFYSAMFSTTIDSQSSFDTNSKIYNYSGKFNYVENEKYYNNEEITEIADIEKRDFHLENKDFEENKHVAILNKNSRLISDTEIEDANIDYVSSLVATSSLYIDYGRIPNLIDWLGYTDKEKSYFKFYVDENVLTVSMEKEIVDEAKKVIKDKEQVTSRTKKTETRTIQLSVDKNEVKYKDYVVSSEKREKIEYLDNYISTDAREIKLMKSTDSYIRLNEKISLSSENLSNYREGREELSSLFFTYLDL